MTMTARDMAKSMDEMIKTMQDVIAGFNGEAKANGIDVYILSLVIDKVPAKQEILLGGGDGLKFVKAIGKVEYEQGKKSDRYTVKYGNTEFVDIEMGR